jgi:N-acetylmuramoyl-L-alanine amidase
MSLRSPALLLLLSLAGHAADSRQLNRIQFWSLGTSTRISIEFSGEFQFKAGRLEKPDRIFFDIPGVTFALDGKTRGLHSVTVGDKLVKQIRVANPLSATMTRVVLDLETEGLLYTASELKAPNRLLVEVYPAGKTPAPGDAPSTSGEVLVTESPKPAAPIETASRPVVPARSAPDRPPAPAVVKSEPPAPQLATKSDAKLALPARANYGGDRSLTRALGLKLKRIVLDPGHGGLDDGTTGYGGLKEKDLVLDIAQRVGALIKEKLPETEVIYTREKDEFVSLERRTEMANERHADLFLSIHANSSTVRSVTGVETYYLSVNGTKAALEVAARENATAQKSIADLNGMIQEIALNDKLKESVEFAGRVQYALVTGTGPPGARARNRGVRRAPFIVLIGARMPSILAEVGFLSNAQEEAAMQKSEYRDRIAEALFVGIDSYAQSLSKYQVASASAGPGDSSSSIAAKPEPTSQLVAAPAASVSQPVRRSSNIRRNVKPTVFPLIEPESKRAGKPAPLRRGSRSAGASN